ncbi:DMT family transporter [Alcaligenes sp. SORT26]|uniref:DMT family transporter n=1 Tax=Alcaligenes sp. SORT26 TaxID=2813780 RepID=UPI001A9FFB8B|nr:DMT family transporter [Alcaligenes sp. SORT26]QTC00355.1 DMT family transporter [Alcaligenes sp. SORT26]
MLVSTQKLTPGTTALLVLPTILWASNAIVGRLIHDQVPPITLNFFRWLVAFTILLFVGRQVLRRGSNLWPQWKRYSILGLLGIGIYNALQYLALQSSSPINVTLVNASLPFWMLVIGRLFFKSTVNGRQLIGGLMSLLGVILVLTRADWHELIAFRFVAGDVYMVIATIAWAVYSWMLSTRRHEGAIAETWATVVMAQVFFGLIWSGAFAAMEWKFTDWHIDWSWALLLAILYVGTGPALVALRCWGVAVQRVGAATAGFFVNLMPVFAALMSVFILGDTPKPYHAAAFLLIVGGIYVSSRKS